MRSASHEHRKYNIKYRSFPSSASDTNTCRGDTTGNNNSRLQLRRCSSRRRTRQAATIAFVQEHPVLQPEILCIKKIRSEGERVETAVWWQVVEGKTMTFRENSATVFSFCEIHSPWAHRRFSCESATWTSCSSRARGNICARRQGKRAAHKLHAAAYKMPGA